MTQVPAKALKSHTTPLNDHVDLQNAMMQSIALPVSCDANANTMILVPESASKSHATPLDDHWELENATMLLKVLPGLHVTDTGTDTKKVVTPK